MTINNNNSYSKKLDQILNKALKRPSHYELGNSHILLQYSESTSVYSLSQDRVIYTTSDDVEFEVFERRGTEFVLSYDPEDIRDISWEMNQIDYMLKERKFKICFDQYGNPIADWNLSSRDYSYSIKGALGCSIVEGVRGHLHIGASLYLVNRFGKEGIMEIPSAKLLYPDFWEEANYEKLSIVDRFKGRETFLIEISEPKWATEALYRRYKLFNYSGRILLGIERNIESDRCNALIYPRDEFNIEQEQEITFQWSDLEPHEGGVKITNAEYEGQKKTIEVLTSAFFIS